MNDQMDERLRSHLGAVESVELANADVIGAGVARAQRRHERNRRAALGSAVAVLVAVGSVVVWNSGQGPERVTSGDGSAPTTLVDATFPPSQAATTAPSTSALTSEAGWAAIPPGPNGAVTGATVVWTSAEAVSVGGQTASGAEAGVSAYMPSRGQWRSLSPEVPLLAPIVVWTGDTVLAVGWTTTGPGRSVAASLSLETGEWTILADALAPDKLWSSDAWAWTGTELLVMSGNHGMDTATVQAFNPATNEWRLLTPAPLSPRYDAASVWTGTEWLIWGGNDDSTNFADGVAYNPVTDTYRPLADSPLSARVVTGVWTGTEMVLLAGTRNGNAESDGAAYNPATDSWRLTKPGFAHPGFVPVWTGSVIIQFAKGGAVWYDPAADEWSSGDMTFGEFSHEDRSPVWTGSQVVLLGSYDGSTGGATFTPPA